MKSTTNQTTSSQMLFAPKIFRFLSIFYITITVMFPRWFGVNTFGISVSPLNVLFLFFIVLCIAMIYTMSQVKRNWLILLQNNIVLCVAVVTFIIWQFICDYASDSTSDTVAWTFRWIINIVSPLFVGSVLFLWDDNRKLFVKVLIVCLLVSCGIGLFEHFTSSSFAMLLNLQSFASDQYAAVSKSMEDYRNGSVRASALFTHPIVFGQIIAAFVPLFYMYHYSKSPITSRIVSISVALVAIYTCTIATGVRSSYIVLLTVAVASLVFVMAKTRNSIPLFRVAAISVALALAIAVVAPILYDVFLAKLIEGSTQEDAGSNYFRLTMMRNGLEHVSKSPIFGYGAGQSIIKAGMISPKSGLATIDSFYLSLILDFGIVGVLVFFVIVVSIIQSGLRAYNCSSSPNDKSIVLCFLAAIFGIMIGQTILSILDNISIIFLIAGYFASRNIRGVPIRATKRAGRRVGVGVLNRPRSGFDLPPKLSFTGS